MDIVPTKNYKLVTPSVIGSMLKTTFIPIETKLRTGGKDQEPLTTGS